MIMSDGLRQQLKSWSTVMQPFIESTAFDSIINTLRTEVQNKKTVIPASSDMFQVFSKCSMDKVKAVVMMMEPYSILHNGKMNGGIPLDCSGTGISSSTLDSWYTALEISYGFKVDMDQTLDMSYLLEEGVLLVNCALTTIKDCPGAHQSLWRPFTEHLIKVINEEYRALPICLVGTQAQKYEQYIDTSKHYVLCVEHPMVAISANKRLWNFNNLFRWCNEIIEKINGPESLIQWWKWKQSIPVNNMPPWVEDRVWDSCVSQLPF